MDVLTYIVAPLLIFLIIFLIFAAIARLIFRVNAQLDLLEKISKNLETLVSLEKTRKH
jgi:hypothetical protein